MKIMQKIFLILSFTLLSICALQSCDGNGHIDPDIIPGGGSTGGVTSGNINGVWVPTDDPEIAFYWEFKGGMVYYYEIKHTYWDNNYYAEFKDGVLYVPKGRTWELIYKQKFKIEKGDIYVDGYRAGSVRFLSKDKAIFDSQYLVDGVVERVKQFKEKPINNS